MGLVGSLPRSISEIRKIRVNETRIELPPTWRFYPARLGKLERFVLKETTHTAVPHEQRAVHFFPAQFANKNPPE